MVLKSDIAIDVKHPKNAIIVKEFIKLLEQLKYEIEKSKNRKELFVNQIRLRRMKENINIIKQYPHEITSGSQLKDIKGIGKGTITRIDEILKSGKLKEIKVSKKYKKHIQYIEELEKIIGIGPKLALKLVREHKIKSVKELKKAYKAGKIELNDQILLGLKYEGIHDVRISRSEIDDIKKYLEKVIKKVDKNLEMEVCGSYRRGKPSSNDVDVLLVNKKIKTKLDLKMKTNYLDGLVKKLKQNRFLVDSLSLGDSKYMGFCKYKKNPVRRIDIKYMPMDSYYTALLHFTGSANFNARIRGVAKDLGYKLNEYGLYKISGKLGKKMKINSEKDVFKILGLEYVTPEKR